VLARVLVPGPGLGLVPGPGLGLVLGLVSGLVLGLALVSVLVSQRQLVAAP